MKKALSVFLSLLLLVCPALAGQESDAVSSASTVYYFDGISGDELMDAINSYSGFYAIASVNADGTPNIAFFVYGMVKLEETYYVQLGLSPNQTTLNIDGGSELMAMYGMNPVAFPYASVGARMYLSKVTDEETLTALSAFSPAGYTPLYYEVTRTVPMG
ncbi:MAG: hypothetical protein IKR85_01655 [Clostridia bacterium]|nr:hypothetical protein [Clostridia bacterium]